MKLKVLLCWFLIIIIFGKAQGQKIDYVQSFKDTLVSLAEKSDNAFFKMHCNAIISVINSRSVLYATDSTFLKNTYNAFINESNPANAQLLSTYLQRKRPLIISWVSPADGEVSFSWLTLPKDWNPENTYPLYIQLHGLWNVAGNPIEYMTYPYLNSPSGSTSFEDGYLLSPWGRGNFWYKGISETDIWECMAALENVAFIDQSRKYLSGHSMGGYGAWSIGSKSAGTWAALGIHAGALWYYPDLVNANTAEALRDIPVYFVCGTKDGLMEVNLEAYHLLQTAGNGNLQFNTFNGGHEYLEQNVLNMYLWMRQFTKGDLPTGIIQANEATQSGWRISCNPNPVTASSKITYSGPGYSTIEIGIYDLYGRVIDGVTREVNVPGEHSINYDASELKPGIYLVRLKSGDHTAGSKMVVIH